MDKYIADYIARNKNLTPDQFIKLLNTYYNFGEAAKRIPNVKIPAYKFLKLLNK